MIDYSSNAGREIFQREVLEALQQAVTRPWWGTSTQLRAVLDRYMPTRSAFRSPRALSSALDQLDESGRLDGWDLRRWRTSATRMIGIVPPGWFWSEDRRCWLLHGVPQPLTTV